MTMDKTPILLLLLLPVLILADDAQEKAIGEYIVADCNSDGDLTVNEISYALHCSDRKGNNDGVIDLEEYKKVFFDNFENSTEEAAINLFNAYDVNNDTAVDNEDCEGLRQKMNENDDEKLTQDEFVAWILPYIVAAIP